MDTSDQQAGLSTVVNDPTVDPDAPAGGGGQGYFRTAKSPVPMGLGSVDADACRLSNLDPRYCEEVKPGTSERVTDEDGNLIMLIERKKDGLYYWRIQTADKLKSCEGVYDPETEFVGEACEDKTSKRIAQELDKQVIAMKKPTGTKPPPERRKILLINIIKGDWLTKISRDLWGTFDWERHLKPTQDTLDRRTREGKEFDPDLIYPGDTFEIIGEVAS